MVFSNVDAFDEGEMAKLTAFMEMVVKVRLAWARLEMQ